MQDTFGVFSFNMCSKLAKNVNSCEHKGLPLTKAVLVVMGLDLHWWIASLMGLGRWQDLCLQYSCILFHGTAVQE